jgi:hypothetical protein
MNPRAIGQIATRRGAALLLSLSLLSAAPVAAQIDVDRQEPCCTIEDPRVVWTGQRATMTLAELAAHVAPVLWFSPDEPLLRGLERPAGIDIPTAFPFEEPAAGPVAYYRVRRIIRGGPEVPVTFAGADRGEGEINLDAVTAVDLDFYFYYPSEEGLGGHVHDVESVEMKVGVLRQPRCEDCRYGLIVVLANALAHGLSWYDNTLETDKDTVLPLTILVEEGKHASCTDKNGDGYYTPGYDVTERVNDAWGVRDIMRTGALFTGGFQSWLAKVRQAPDRVVPPLPPENRHHDVIARMEKASGLHYPRYELRPYPRLAAARAHNDPSIMRFVDKGYDDWPEVDSETPAEEIVDWVSVDDFTKTFSVMARFDDDVGISMVFPLFLFRNFTEPMSGGWIVNRIYLKDHRLRDFGYNLMYMPSASRWIDGYFSVGLEVDKETDSAGVTRSNTAFTTETGMKFRGNVAHSPLSFLSSLTHFWGLRVGVRYKGYAHFDEIGYVIEVGAGAF